MVGRAEPWLGFWLAMTASASALAQPPAPEPAAVAEASALEAYATSRDPARLLEVAEARLAEGDGPGAVEALERFLVVAPGAPEAEAIRARIAALELAPTTLTITSTPPGAQVRVDGEPAGATPLRVDVPAGAHELEVLLAGHVTAHERVVVGYASRRAVQVPLEPEPTPPPTDERFGAGPPIEVPPPEAAAEAAPGERKVGAAVWATSGIAAGALVVGTVFGFLALAEESEFNLHPTEAHADRGERYALLADISFGVAAASAITALVLWLRPEPPPGRAEARLRLRFDFDASPSGAGLGARLAF
jgi:hypothetical protein